MARHNETYSPSSAGGRGGSARVTLLEIDPTSPRADFESRDERRGPLDGSFAGGVVEVDNDLS